MVEQVKQARFFTILADETSDVSQTEKLSLCLRYYCNKTIREEFIGFVDVHDVTAQGIKTKILGFVERLGLEKNNIVGQGYDGAAVMRGAHSGVQRLIREEVPTAVYTHCVAHCLNLVITSSSKVTAIKNAFVTISKIVSMFRNSTKKSNLFTEAAKSLDVGKTVLSRLSDTRWVERHDGILTFAALYSAIVMTLSQISTWQNDPHLSLPFRLKHVLG